MRKRKGICAAAGILAALTLFAGCSKPDGEKKTESSAADSSVGSVQVESSQENSKTESSGKKNNPESSDDKNSSTESSGEKNSSQESSDDKSSSPESSGEISSLEQSTITPAVWEVTDQNGNNIYMMGSIHIAKEDASVLPDYFETAYAKCDALAVECDVLDNSVNIASLSKVLYTDGTKISDHVPASDYKNAKATLESLNYYQSMYDYYYPIMWVEMAELGVGYNIGFSDKYGVDTILLDRAKKENKEILELESVQFQLDLIVNLPEKVQLALFHDIADKDYISRTSEQLSNLYDKWRTGTIEDNYLFSENSELSKEEAAIVEEYNKIILDDRNVGMKNKIEGYLADNKKVMVVAGSAHFYGDKGIVSLLEKDGYTIRRLTADDAKQSEKAESSAVSSSAESSVQNSETDPGLPRAA